MIFIQYIKQVVYCKVSYLNDFVSWIPCRWFSYKKIHKEDIKYWKKRICILIFEMKKCLPSTFFNAQEHYLIHLVEEIELCGLVQTRSMWMVERHLKFMKGLVWQREHPEGSMVEGYMVYNTIMYISEYLPNFSSKFHVDHIWDPNSINRFEGEYFMVKGRLRKVRDNYKMLL